MLRYMIAQRLRFLGRWWNKELKLTVMFPKQKALWKRARSRDKFETFSIVRD